MKVGDRLEIQPLWNESARTDKLIGPLEVVAIRHTSRSQSGCLISVRQQGDEYPRCLDAAWFIGPLGLPKEKREDGWWIAKES